MLCYYLTLMVIILARIMDFLNSNNNETANETL